MNKNSFTAKFKTRIKNKLRTMCGIPVIEEEIDSIYYILSNGLDISGFPKATGELRKYQLADTELLRLFHEACQKHNLTYWLDWGTLLGSIRHNGFIPWDDDLDVCMPRADFNEAKTIITEEFTKLGFNTVVKNAIYIWNEKNGVALDIFAVDQTSFNGDDSALEHRADEFLAMCRRDYEPGDWRIMNGIDEKREQIMGGSNSESVIYYSALETTGRLCKYTPEDIFPLSKHMFEKYEFMVPRNYDAYLKTQYPDYMSFPRGGILHHNKSNLPIYLRALHNHENLDSVTQNLSSISLM